ncbi:RNA polymerase II degradation factor 1 [Olea europaea subsp. europaea]|uniref:RNA polymerase II degradation factor 1 n=1 Tax=Olea europaea subsp. europaea TaxID=158383 RepID=A0A8S0QFI8_OLEEU|nr:RNA polymerase II degradation factor 1 [Olea europaea subsp. europaea]
MDPLPPPLQPSAAPPISTTNTTAAAPPPLPTQVNYPDSLDSSPRSRNTNSWDDPSPPLPQPSKLRLMCSYGGHIVPRPQDKSLCYIGGDTRIIVIDRHTSLTSLHNRLSKALLNNQPFTLKYQLPNEELDSLISVATDEDLENMVEEYDRLCNSSALKPGRLRLFLFLKSSSIEQLLVETASTKSDDWFLNALNGKDISMTTSAKDCDFAESSSVNSLLGFDDDSVDKEANTRKYVESQMDSAKNDGNGNGTIINHDVHSVPDSPVLEANSSFGSASSSPSLANLRPIRVRSEENQKVERLGIEQQFQRSVVVVEAGGNVNLPQKQEEGSFVPMGWAAGTVVSGVPVAVGGGGEYANRTFSDDDRSDHGEYRRVQQAQQQAHVHLQQQQTPQFQHKQVGPIDLPSPDSVSSEGSVNNPLSRQRQTIYQEPMMQIQSGNYRIVSANEVDPKIGDQNHNRVQMHQQVPESGYVLSSQFDQTHSQLPQMQHFVHAGTQYIPAGAMPMPSYYPMYPSQQQQPHHPVLEQQYPFYFVPGQQAQGYHVPMQQVNYSESMSATSTHPQMPPPGSMAPSSAHNQGRNAFASESEIAGGVQRTAAQQLVQDLSSQQQGQCTGFTQIHYPSQSMAPPSAANSNYAYEFTDPSRSQIYYTQPLPPQVAAQYQSMASAPAGTLPEVSTQLSMLHPTGNKASR